MRQSAVFDVRGLLARYDLPVRMKAEMEAVLTENLKRILSRTRSSSKSASIKTQERRMYTVCRSFVELREVGFMIEPTLAAAQACAGACDEVGVGWPDRRDDREQA